LETGNSQENQRIKVIFVDLDGTLADSLEGLYQVYQEFLSLHKRQGYREEFNELIGPTLAEIVDLLKERYALSSSPAELMTEYRTLLRTCYATTIAPFERAKECLSFLQQAGVKLYLVTSAEKELADLFLRQHRLERVFEKVIAGEEGEPGKPNPALYLRALKEASVLRNEAVAIEDSEKGIQSAREAGLTVLTFCPRGVQIEAGIPCFSDWLSIKRYFRENNGILSDV
jgi:beta-phosphoglucomutase